MTDKHSSWDRTRKHSQLKDILGYVPESVCEDFGRSSIGTNSPKWPAVIVSNAHYMHRTHRKVYSTAILPGGERPVHVGDLNWSPSADTIAHHLEEARRKMDRRMLSLVSSVTTNAIDNLRTARQTSNMIAGTATRLAKALHSLRRKQFPKAAEVLGLRSSRWKHPRTNTPSGQWLELQYGWLPLLGDIRKAIDGTAEAAATGVLEAYGTSKGFEPFVQTAGEHFGDYSLKVRQTGRLTIVLDGPAIRAAADIGITNLPLAAWEATPYSFVADWVLPVSDWLEGLRAFDGLRVVESNRTWSYDYKILGTIGNPDYEHFPALTGYFNHVKHRERVLNYMPVADFPSLTGPFNKPLDVALTRAANALSLLAEGCRRTLR